MRFEDLDYSVVSNNTIEIYIMVENDYKDVLTIDKVTFDDHDFNELWTAMEEAHGRYKFFRDEYSEGEVSEISVCDGKLCIYVTFEPDDWECIYG